MRKVGYCLVALLAVCFALLADVVNIADGGKVVGKIIRETEDEVTILTVRGVILRVPKERIESIERGSPEEIYKKRLAEIPEEDVDSLYQLALWCRDVGLKEHAKQLFRKIIKISPNHRELSLIHI